MTPTDNTASFCNWISPNKYLTSMTNYTLQSTVYGINCDIIEGSQGTPCGVNDPTGPSNCTSYSTKTNSCCYYNKVAFCFWLGFKGYGKLQAFVQCDTASSSFLSILTLLSTLVSAIILF